VDTLSDQISQFVRVLTDHWNADSSWAIEVQMCQFVSQELDDVSWPHTRVFNNVVGSRVDGSLSHTLRDQEEIVSFWQGHHVVENRSGWRIHSIITVHFVKSSVHPLRDDDIGEFRITSYLFESFSDFSNFHIFGLRFVHRPLRHDTPPLVPEGIHCSFGILLKL